MSMYDVIIIGGGPAGVSAGLYAVRAGASVLLTYAGKSTLEHATQIDNYYGFKNGISGKDLFENGIAQIEKLGAVVKNAEVVGIEQNSNGFKVAFVDGEISCKTVILATGNKKIEPNIIGVKEFNGKGISYCAICDSFFYRNKKVAVIGDGDFALTEASILKNVASSVTVLTNGKHLKTPKFNIIEKPITKIFGEQTVAGVSFSDGSTLAVDGIFVAMGQAGAVDFAKTMGVLTNKDEIVVDADMCTNVKGLFACGDVVGGLKQVCKSVYDGAVAGLSAIEYIKGVKNND